MISVVVLNWNGKPLLKECLHSLREQTHKDYEIILVDNGSNDGSVEYVKNNFPEVKVLALDKNYGFCQGNNEGIKISRGEYVVLLNNDTMATPQWLAELYKAISSNPGVGFCASKMLLYSDHEKIDSAGDGYSLCGAPFKRGNLEKSEKYNQEELVFGACAGAALYRRSMLDDIGLLDEDFFAIAEDTDIGFRAQLKGYKCLYAPRAIIYHKVNVTLGRMSDFYVSYGQRNIEYAYIKNMPLALVLRTLPSHLIYNLAGFFYFLSKGKGWVFLKAKFSVLLNLRKLLKKRKIIQKNCKVNNNYIKSMMEKRCFSVRIKGKI